MAVISGPGWEQDGAALVLAADIAPNDVIVFGNGALVLAAPAATQLVDEAEEVARGYATG